MKIGILKPILSKWQFGFEIGWRPEIIIKWPFIRIWAFKLIQLPEPGTMLSKTDYKGFYWYYAVPLPDITMRRFRLGRTYFAFPIKIRF